MRMKCGLLKVTNSKITSNISPRATLVIWSILLTTAKDYQSFSKNGKAKWIALGSLQQKVSPSLYYLK